MSEQPQPGSLEGLEAVMRLYSQAIDAFEEALRALYPPSVIITTDYTNTEATMSEQPIDEDQSIAGNVTHNASTMTTGGPATAVRYGQVAGWEDYLAACRDRDQARADLAALVVERDNWQQRAVEEARRNLANGQARMEAEAERDRLAADLAALRPLVRAVRGWVEGNRRDEDIFYEAEMLDDRLRAWALEGE